MINRKVIFYIKNGKKRHFYHMLKTQFELGLNRTLTEKECDFIQWITNKK